MISRQWRGLAKAGSAEEYVHHLQSETFPAIAKLPGFIGASILRRIIAEGAEFLIVTQWTSIEAIKAFAGENAETAVVPKKVQEMMVDFDRTVRHFEVIQSA